MSVYEEVLTGNIPNSRETQINKFKNFQKIQAGLGQRNLNLNTT